MPCRVTVLLIVAGLLVPAFAAQSADVAAPAGSPARHRLDRDSLLILHAKGKRLPLPSGIDVNKVIRWASHPPTPEPSHKLYTDLFTEENPEFPVAPGIPTAEDPNAQRIPAVAFDGENYLVVWHDGRGDGNNVCGMLVPADGSDPSDTLGFEITANAPWDPEFQQLAVAFDGSRYLVVWTDDRNRSTTGYDIYGALVNKVDGNIYENDIPYNPLHDLGYPSIGCTHCTRKPAEGEDARAGRWAGTTKTECGLHG